MVCMDSGERRYKKGEIIYRAGTFDTHIYNVLFGSVGIYMHYGQPDEHVVLEIPAGDFLNVISFLEMRPRNTTAVALEPTIIGEISRENFARYFQENPGKIMSLLEHLSARVRHLQKAYLEACQALEEYANTEKLKQEKGDWYASHSKNYQFWSNLFLFGSGEGK